MIEPKRFIAQHLIDEALRLSDDAEKSRYLTMDLVGEHIFEAEQLGKVDTADFYRAVGCMAFAIDFYSAENCERYIRTLRVGRWFNYPPDVAPADQCADRAQTSLGDEEIPF